MDFQRTKYSLVLCLLLLAACASTGPISTVMPFASPVTTSAPLTPTVEPCAFVEAHQSLPELSAQMDAAIKQLQPDASAHAAAYGENCVYASSGQSTFSAMETDFYIAINVRSLKDNNELGIWIIKTMKIVTTLPSASIPGPQVGFVEFTFKTKDNQKILRVSIDKYKSLPADISPSDVINTLFPNP
jgi:hypothetical protein